MTPPTAPGLRQRAKVLVKGFSLHRARMALSLLRRQGPGVLLRQIAAHTTYRSRLHEVRQAGLATGLVPPGDDNVTSFHNHSESAWPGDAPLISVIAGGAVEAQTFTSYEVLPFHDVARARGKYLCFLHGGDRIYPTYLEKAAFLLEVCGADIVSASIDSGDAGFGVLPAPTLRDLTQRDHVADQAVFRRGLWPKGMTHAPDGAFWRRLAADGARILNLSGERLITAPPPHAAAVREAIPEQALRRSDRAARRRLRAPDGLRHLIDRMTVPARRPAILLAMPFLTVGGAERLLSAVVAGLARHGYDIVIVTTMPHWTEADDTTSWFETTTREIYHLPRCFSQSRWSDFVEYLIASRNIRAILLAGSQFIYDRLPDIKARHPQLRVADLLFNTVAHAYNNRRWAELIDVTVSEGNAVRAWLESEGRAASRVRVIPGGIDLSRLNPSDAAPDARQRLGAPAGAFTVGFAGRWAEEKDPLGFVRIAAACTHRSIHYLMAGAGPLEATVRAAAAQNAPAGRFTFLGQVPDIVAFLAGLDALVVPSIFDGRPLVVMEALAMGVPVIASRVGSIPELIINGETGFLCEPGVASGFAARIAWLRRHPDAHARMRQAARAHALAHFGLDRTVEAYADLFDSLTRTY